MEKMFPFLHEDVLYIINEYAREHTEKKELCSAIFNKYLFMSLVKAKIRYRWIVMIKSFAFKNINEFTNLKYQWQFDKPCQSYPLKARKMTPN